MIVTRKRTYAALQEDHSDKREPPRKRRIAPAKRRDLTAGKLNAPLKSQSRRVRPGYDGLAAVPCQKPRPTKRHAPLEEAPLINVDSSSDESQSPDIPGESPRSRWLRKYAPRPKKPGLLSQHSANKPKDIGGGQNPDIDGSIERDRSPSPSSSTRELWQERIDPQPADAKFVLSYYETGKYVCGWVLPPAIEWPDDLPSPPASVYDDEKTEFFSELRLQRAARRMHLRDARRRRLYGPVADEYPRGLTPEAVREDLVRRNEEQHAAIWDNISDSE